MRRRLFTLLSALSLLLCVGTCGLWARSYARIDNFLIDIGGQHRSLSGHYVISSSWGIVFIDLSEAEIGAGDGFHVEHSGDDAPEDILASRFPHPNENLGGVVYRWRAFRYWKLPGDCALAAPFWSLAVVTSITPLLFCARRLAKTFSRKRIKNGCCPTCGYDLRATPGRCPECGVVPTAAKVKA